MVEPNPKPISTTLRAVEHGRTTPSKALAKPQNGPAFQALLEKLEGEALELDGKANKLSQMIRQNLPAAMQGLVVVPLFAGYDLRRRTGRLWKFDITGGRYEETDFESTGSGGLFARESLKKSHRSGATRDEAVRIAVLALTDAADEDRATGGVDVVRRIFPILDFCTQPGIQRVPDAEIESVYREILSARSGGSRS